MEAEGGAHGAQIPRTSPAEGGGRLQKTRKRRSWTAEEDAVLAAHVRAHGVGKWDAVPQSTGLPHTGQSCRFRWLNSLRPGLKDGVAFSRDEELHLCRLHAALGNKWSRIAAEMEGRSENEVRHYWFCYVSRCQQAGLNVYPPEVQQAAAGQSAPHQPQPKRHKSQTSSLPQQPPPPPSLLPVGYANYPVVPTHPPQPLGAVYPVTMATVPPPPPFLPVMAEFEALPDSQFWPLFLALMNQDVEQGTQPQPPPLGNTTEFNENCRRMASSLRALLNQNVEQGRQPQPPSILLGDATEFNEENQLLAPLLLQSNQNVEQEMQPPALLLENAIEFNEEDQLLTSQNVEQGWQPPPPARPLENATEFNEEDQHLASVVPLSDQNAEAVTVAGATVGET